MEVRMESTAGLGRQAEVWVDGHLLTVCDGVSESGRPHPPGELRGVKFSYLTMERFTWEQAVLENPGEKRQLSPVTGWSYVGYGQVISIMPVVVDFGLLRMEDANWTNDRNLVGKFVKVFMDRLEIGRAGEPDWPEGIR